MFGFLSDIVSPIAGVVGDVARVVATPVVVAAEVTRAATKPVADTFEDLAKDVRDALK